MTNRFVISDTHFGHTNAWEKFKREDGSPLRPFTSTEEMNETMVERWNAKVGPNDVVALFLIYRVSNLVWVVLMISFL